MVELRGLMGGRAPAGINPGGMRSPGGVAALELVGTSEKHPQHRLGDGYHLFTSLGLITPERQNRHLTLVRSLLDAPTPFRWGIILAVPIARAARTRGWPGGRGRHRFHQPLSSRKAAPSFFLPDQFAQLSPN